jgi:hypothetical protein
MSTRTQDMFDFAGWKERMDLVASYRTLLLSVLVRKQTSWIHNAENVGVMGVITSQIVHKIIKAVEKTE